MIYLDLLPKESARHCLDKMVDEGLFVKVRVALLPLYPSIWIWVYSPRMDA